LGLFIFYFKNIGRCSSSKFVLLIKKNLIGAPSFWFCILIIIFRLISELSLRQISCDLPDFDLCDSKVCFFLLCQHIFAIILFFYAVDAVFSPWFAISFLVKGFWNFDLFITKANAVFETRYCFLLDLHCKVLIVSEIEDHCWAVTDTNGISWLFPLSLCETSNARSVSNFHQDDWCPNIWSFGVKILGHPSMIWCSIFESCLHFLVL
jgi:hypothetical protein